MPAVTTLAAPLPTTHVLHEDKRSAHTPYKTTASLLSMTATTPAAPIACCKGPILNVHKSCSQKAPRQTRSRDCWCSTGARNKTPKIQHARCSANDPCNSNTGSSQTLHTSSKQGDTTKRLPDHFGDFRKLPSPLSGAVALSLRSL
jgi:hypothetical protein